MQVVRFQHSSKGYKAVLRSDEVRQDLERRANKVRAAAQPNTWRRLVADSYIGRGRAGATVFGISLNAEAERRVLGSAMDAAR